MAGISAVLAAVCAASLSARAASLSTRNILVVTTTADVVNGNASSLSALKAKPGRDGISLREALLAADKTGGSATVYIMFSARLNDKAIKPRTPLPPLRRNHLVLEGVAPNGSPAMVTIDGSLAKLNVLDQLLLVQGSDVTVRWLRFTGQNPTGNHTYQEPAIYVIAGNGQALTPGPTHQRLSNVQILDSIFDSRGTTFTGQSTVGPSGVLAFAGPNAQMSDITIARNTFLHETGSSDSVGVWANSSGASIQDVTVQDNRFDQDRFSVELADTLKNPRLTGTRIIGNVMTNGQIGVSLDGNATDGTIDNTLIEDNSISNMTTSALSLNASAVEAMPGQVGLQNAAGDVISNTQIVNNDMSVLNNGIYLEGGNTTTSPVSRVAGVTIENDTLVNLQPNNGYSLFVSVPNGSGASGNQISGVTVRNSVLYQPLGYQVIQSQDAQPPDGVINSLVTGSEYAGTNGNVTGDPLLVNVSAGDDHPTAGSPLVNAGTPVGAPNTDLSGALRDTQPDIGAFEFAATPRPTLTVTSAFLGGSGTVTSSPTGISCGTSCAANFDPDTAVVLTAKPDQGSKFVGWGPPCSGKAPCTLNVKDATSVTARFAP